MPQVRMPIEPEHGDAPRFLGPQELGHGIADHHTHPQGLFDRPANIGQGMLLQQPQHADVFPCAVACSLVLQATPQRGETLG
jgi:hypothetical protein